MIPGRADAASPASLAAEASCSIRSNRWPRAASSASASATSSAAPVSARARAAPTRDADAASERAGSSRVTGPVWHRVRPPALGIVAGPTDRGTPSWLPQPRPLDGEVLIRSLGRRSPPGVQRGFRSSSIRCVRRPGTDRDSRRLRALQAAVGNGANNLTHEGCGWSIGVNELELNVKQRLFLP